MFGEFVTTQIEKGSDRFFQSKDFQVVEMQDVNRFLFPNYLQVLGINIKNLWAREQLVISDSDMKELNKAYNWKDICVPTHWFKPDAALPHESCKLVRLRSSDTRIVKLAYCMWWIKSHIIADNMHAERFFQLDKMREAKHPHYDSLLELSKSDTYHNWKFLSYRDRILTNGKPDLEKYIKAKYVHMFTNNTKSGPNWTNVDVAPLMNGAVSIAERQLHVELDYKAFHAYADKNMQMLKSHLSLSLGDLERGDKWLTVLTEYCREQLKERG